MPAWSLCRADFDFERLEGPSRLNRFHWLGDGWTTAEHEPSGEGDVAWYLTQKGELMPMGQTAPSVHGAGASKLIVHGVEKK